MSPFDPSKYTRQIEESRRRLEITVCFQEPDRVPIRISTSGSYYCRLFGYNIRDYYTDLDCALQVDLKGREWAFEQLQDDRTGYGISLQLGPVYEGLLFDCEIVYPDDTSPWIVPRLETEADVDRLEVPDPASHPQVQRAYRLAEQLQEKAARMGLDIPVGGGFGIHPPLSCACAIMPPEKVYEYMYTNPPLVHKLFRKLFEAFCRLQDYEDAYFGVKKRTSLGLADDNSAFISPQMYKEFVYPYNKALYDRYGSERRHLHADGPNDHHFRMYANEMKLTEMDIGGFSDLANAKREMGGKVVISGGLNNRDFYGTWEQAKQAIERAIRIGAPGGGFILAIGGETYYGVPPDYLIRAVNYAKEIGRYPISVK